MSATARDADSCRDDAPGQSDERERPRSQRRAGRRSTRGCCAGYLADNRWLDRASEHVAGITALHDRFATRAASFFLRVESEQLARMQEQSSVPESTPSPLVTALQHEHPEFISEVIYAFG